MKKLLLGLLLIITSTSVMAKWTKIDGNDELTSYAELSTIRKKGSIVRMLTLFDIKKPQMLDNQFYKSIKNFHEFDCANKQSRVLKLYFYSENMEGGNLIYTYSEERKWSSLPPDGQINSLYKLACRKK